MSGASEEFAERAADDGFLRRQGIELDRERVLAAAATYEALRPAIEELRRVPLSFIDPWEPASALAWLENGGEL
jgi:hypothetical protein